MSLTTEKYEGTQNRLAELKLTKEEEVYLKECIQSKFWKSSFPLTVASAVMGYSMCTVISVQKAAKYAAITLGSLGYLTSRIANAHECLRNVANMNLPNSTLKATLEQWKTLSPPRVLKEEDVVLDVTGDPQTPQTDVDDYRPMDSFDTFSSINGIDSYSEDNDLAESPPSRSTLTYDELRRRNREEYYRAQQEELQGRAMRQPVRQTKRLPPEESPINDISARKTNKYGDMFE